MTWITPRTWVTGEVVTAAQMNTHVRDNEAELKDTLVGDVGATIIHRHLSGALGGRPAAASNNARVYLVTSAGVQEAFIEGGAAWLQLLLMPDGIDAQGQMYEHDGNIIQRVLPNFWPFMPPPSPFP